MKLALLKVILIFTPAILIAWVAIEVLYYLLVEQGGNLVFFIIAKALTTWLSVGIITYFAAKQIINSRQATESREKHIKFYLAAIVGLTVTPLMLQLGSDRV